MNLHSLQIIADKNIPFIYEAFKGIGSIQLLDSEQITREALKNCDILIIRYVTRIDANLLQKSAVKFVGTVSSGTDHVDIGYLKDRNIAFASAPGSNANSVAEYIMAALFSLHARGKINIGKVTLGIIGVGNVGSNVVQKAKDLGIKILLNDPPKYRHTKNPIFRPLDELMNCDILTIHTPLIFSGIDKTYRLFDSNRLSKLKRNTIIINSARGGIVDENALEDLINSKHITGAVIDVWENEPRINRHLLDMVDIGTPHLAGLSQDGRVAATVMIHQAVCDYFELSNHWFPPSQTVKSISYNPRHLNDIYFTVDRIVRQIFDIDKDANDFKRGILKKNIVIGKFFSDFRKKYLNRNEFPNYKIRLSMINPDLKKMLKNLGFGVY